MKLTLLVSASLLLAASMAAHAGDFGNHPATTERSLPSIDASGWVYGHPASPLARAEHANHEHPAVTAARHASESVLNADNFIVQPPASTHWTASPDALVSQVAHTMQ